ncbi:tetratricopeptide repeat protein [Shewanella yunxiaonensis]|nr:tetratricopeptide repeat protein [Shewanella yunxiaonensis]
MGSLLKLNARNFSTPLLLGMLIIAGGYLTGCASHSAPQAVKQEPQRQDLFDDQTRLVARPKAPPQSEQEALDKALKEEQTGRLDKALYLYIQALDFNPTNAKTFYKIAKIHTLRGNEDIALRAFNEALQLDPDFILAHAELGIIEMDQHEYAQARIHLEKAIELDQRRLKENKGSTISQPANFPLDQQSPLRVYNALGVLNDLQDRHQLARDYFHLALDYQPHSAALATNLGYSYYLSGDLQQAESYLKRAIQDDASFARAWSNLGLIYIRKHQDDLALSMFEQTMSKADALNDLGYFLMLEGQYDKAISIFKQAIDASPSYFEKAQKNLKRAQAELLHSEAQHLQNYGSN